MISGEKGWKKTMTSERATRMSRIEGGWKRNVCEILQHTKATGEGIRKGDMIMIGGRNPDEEGSD